MENLQSVLHRIRSFFNFSFGLDENNRKRRAMESIDNIRSNKYRKVYLPKRRSYVGRENYYKTPLNNKEMDSICLDDDDDSDIIDCKHINGSFNSKVTSTPFPSPRKSITDINSDVLFVKEEKSPALKQLEAAKKGLNYLSSNTGTKPKALLRANSIRLDEKSEYKKLLENTANTHHFYGKSLFNRPKLCTKDVIRNVLDKFDGDSVVIESDSDSDVVVVNLPEPKPDFPVEPVNSLKILVDTHPTTKTEWLESTIKSNRIQIEQRKKELEEYEKTCKKYEEINRQIRLDQITEKLNRAVYIKDIIFPIEEQKEEIELPPLTEDQIKMVKRAFKGGHSDEILVSKFNLNITRRDILTLSGLNWLNDEVINFYMNMIIERGKNDKWPNSYAFNTFFYPKLLKDGPQSLKRWTKRIDIFQQDFICIPIHLGMHWCMAVIDFTDKTIKYYDSMGGSNNECLHHLKKYLEAEHFDKKKSHFDTSDFLLENVKDIPQQMNGSDCGMFSCTFAEFITRNAKINFTQEDMPYLRKKMVVEILTGELLIH